MLKQKKINFIGILGPTASGKSDLAIRIAQDIDAEIFSLDSLSIYQEINIASAKPKKNQLQTIKHYGIDELRIPQVNNAIIFKNLLDFAITNTGKKTLIITGGSSFYLKSIIEGLSPIPSLDVAQKQGFEAFIKNHNYDFLLQIDPVYAAVIKPTDTYRIYKALEIYFITNMPPTLYFKSHPRIPFPYPIKIYVIKTDRKLLRENIQSRTSKMLEEGIVEEISALVQKYPLDSQPFRAIGPKECIAYLKGDIDKLEELKYLIFTHTAQLAKRQDTFNRTQFKDIILESKEQIYESILAYSQRKGLI
ncbi:tRNA (adenosine(37)-N6)-dimethylallyltransferase MiaA [Helicobacter sp. 13S00477-4]|uniref:tRNA (adenosine(37)-N6)-dimethylallyltransferase MiaA n=1 Tax=Helicobacter sp. 13S00477-4 TaxID=1905759 RepID=UPI000BA5FA32|nr:tRNA (adenosine(37)-N6)-dimethylallyltransferase MiaA [Helicobacter sp. 13S00477-4]PAF52487.1 tRNA (adenosine(37)-N6)-dimethylallyltransferase MiaA [Helicobacter sp. 13S00477-4]